MRRKIVSSLISVGIAAALFFAFIHFFGDTTIVARHDGQNVPCKVYINDEYKGDTPLKLRLGAGEFSIRIEPPPGYRTGHSGWQFWTMGRGQDLKEELELVQYSAEFRAPYEVIANFKVNDTMGKQVAECTSDENDSEFCEVVLPGPGKYPVQIMELCEVEPCRTGTATLTVDDHAPKSVLNWK